MTTPLCQNRATRLIIGYLYNRECLAFSSLVADGMLLSAGGIEGYKYPRLPAI